MSQKSVLVLCGVSGSGKTTLADTLSKDNFFNVWTQYSTRKMRHGETQGNPYRFVSKEEILDIKDKLVGRTGFDSTSQFRDMYGSLADYQENKVSVVILNAEGILDFHEATKDDPSINVLYLCLDISNDYYEKLNQDSAFGRDRSIDFVRKERAAITSIVPNRLKNFFIHVNDEKNRLDVEGVKDLLTFFKII